MTREVRVRIRWRDLDAYGHVNNAVYLNYLEESRDRMVEDLFGADLAWDFVLARVEIDFRRQLTQDDQEVVVRCAVASVGRSSICTSEQILTAGGTVAAEARSVIVPRDPDGSGSRPLTEAERTVLVAEIGPGASPPGASDDATPVNEVVAIPAVADPHDRDAADAAG